MPITLTDAERAFAGSPKGRMEVSSERRRFELGQAHKGDHAARWTDAMEAETVRRLAALDARSRVSAAAALSSAPARIADAQVAYQASQAARHHHLATAYRGGR